MNILVTGATGFLGTHLVRKLEKLGWQAQLRSVPL